MWVIALQGGGLLAVGIWGTISCYREFGDFAGPAPWFGAIGALELCLFFFLPR